MDRDQLLAWLREQAIDVSEDDPTDFYVNLPRALYAPHVLPWAGHLLGTLVSDVSRGVYGPLVDENVLATAVSMTHPRLRVCTIYKKFDRHRRKSRWTPGGLPNFREQARHMTMIVGFARLDKIRKYRNLMRDAGLKVDGIAAVVDPGDGTRETLAREGYELKALTLLSELLPQE